MMWLVVFLAGAVTGAVILALIMSSVWEDNERRYWRGWSAAVKAARAGLIPGLEPNPGAVILTFPKSREVA